MKKLVISIFTLILAATMLGTSTFAWFSMNRKVDVGGLKVQAKSASSLIITTGALPTATDDSDTVDFADTTATKLYACTHDSEPKTATSGETAYKYKMGLCYYSDQANISAKTGFADSGNKSYGAIPESNPSDGVYYVEKTIYICSVGDALDDQDLKIRWNGISKVTDIDGAISIDFYYATTTSAQTAVAINKTTFAGTLNLAYIGVNGKDKNGNAHAAGGNYTPVDGTISSGDEKDLSEYCVTISDVDIPKNDGTSAIAVRMLIYLDGGLLDTATSCFVKNADAANISAQTLAIRFDSVAHPTSN